MNRLANIVRILQEVYLDLLIKVKQVRLEKTTIYLGLLMNVTLHVMIGNAEQNIIRLQALAEEARKDI